MIEASCHMQGQTSVDAPFIQLMSLGFLWTFLHCAPMCGPIVTGLQLDNSLTQMRFRLLSGLALYQSGRAIVYALIGAIAGGIGGTLELSPIWSWLIVVVMAILLLIKLFPSLISRLSTHQAVVPKFLDRAVYWVSQIRGPARPFFLGLVFSLLPCMLVAWATTLAASTHSPGLGALLMVLLVGLSTLPLLMTTALAQKLRLTFVRSKQRELSIVLLSFSLIWTLLVTLAATGWIPHFHLSLHWFGRTDSIMFW